MFQESSLRQELKNSEINLKYLEEHRLAPQDKPDRLHLQKKLKSLGSKLTYLGFVFEKTEEEKRFPFSITLQSKNDHDVFVFLEDLKKRIPYLLKLTHFSLWRNEGVAKDKAHPLISGKIQGEWIAY